MCAVHAALLESGMETPRQDVGNHYGCLGVIVARMGHHAQVVFNLA